MNLLVLGKGKMGTLIIQLAEQRGHQVRAHDEFDNIKASMLTPERLRDIDVVVDFTIPEVVLENAEAVARAGKNMVVGTTGWYQHIPRIRQMIESNGTGFLYGANFSIGVNLFFQIARTAAGALKQGYCGKITETHHVHKKDAPSGTAVKIQQVVEESGGKKLPIDSIREGEVVGLHTLMLESENDTITLTHDAKSRRGFAEGALRAAEWLKGRRGFYDFKDVFAEV
jgi:4-hydroxy-tetrahydrodipicolinate reductase